MIARNFTYDNVCSQDLGIMICSFGNDDEITTTGSKIEMAVVKVPNSNKWVKTNCTYNEQLVFNFSFCKNPCECDYNQEEMVFSSEEQRKINCWLQRNDFLKLSFDEDGFENIYYYASIYLEKKQVANRTIGFNVTATCNAPWGFSENITYKIKQTSNDYDCLLLNNSDDFGLLLPDKVVIECTADGDCEMSNLSTNMTTRIKNIVAGEIITISDKRIYTNLATHKNIYDDFNWVFPKLKSNFRDNVNKIKLKNCTVIITFTEARRVVL